MQVFRQADDPFVCFGAKPDKGFGLEISDATGSRQGNVSQELEEGTQRRQLATGDAEWQLASRHRTSERPVAWERVQQQWGKTSQDELAFLVAL